MRPDTQNWIQMSEYDLETARHMLATGRFLYVYMCHLAIEKMLKAHVTEVTQSVPPKTELQVIIRRFRAELEEMGIRCERILLFGSQATGTATEGSDIDLFVVSPDWAGNNDRERFEILGIAAARILEPIQARGVIPDEIATRRLSPFWEQVLNEQAVAVL